MYNYIQKLELIEFFKVYPNIIPKIDYENTNKYINYFKKNQKLLNKYNEKKAKKPKYSFSNSKSLLNKSNKKNNTKPVKKRKISLYKNDKQKQDLLFSNSYNNDTVNKEINNDINLNKKEENKINNNISKKGKDKEKEEDYYLINKGIFLQNNKQKRTEDVRWSLEVFLFHSKFFETLTYNLNIINSKLKNSKKFFTNKDGQLNEEELKFRIENKLNNIVLSLSEKVIIHKYPKNNFVIKMNEIGKNCYFLVSGKVSILKPVQYKNIKITLKEYLIYIKCLLNLDEIDLVLKILSENRRFLDITTIKQINKLIRAYFIVSLNKELNRNIEGITMEEIEKFFKFFHFTLEEFQFDLKKILKDI